MTFLSHLPFVIFLGALLGFGWVRINTILTYFQQEEYDSSRFLGAVFRVRLFDILATPVSYTHLTLPTTSRV